MAQLVPACLAALTAAHLQRWIEGRWLAGHPCHGTGLPANRHLRAAPPPAGRRRRCAL